MSDKYKFNIEPETALIDEKVKPKLSGFSSKERVTIYAISSEYYSINRSCQEKSSYESYAIFEADDDGNIDLSKQAPIEGCYSGINSMGLIEFMKAVTTIQEVPKTKLDQVKLDKGYKITFIVKVNNETIIEKDHYRMFRGDDVKCVEINNNNLVARYFTLDDDTPKPGIIVLGGSEGGMEKAQINAELFASYGYSALALCYFGLENLPSSLEKVPLEYIENAIKWMENEPTVISNKILLYGRSKGGELALLAASMFKSIKGVIANTPSIVVWRGLTKKNRPSKYSSWSYKGKEIPSLKINSLAGYKFIIKKILDKPSQISDIYKESLNNPKAQEFIIPVEKINGPVLLFSSGEDEFWTSKTFCENVMKRLEECKFKYIKEHYCYNNAGHFITLPYQGLREGQHNVEKMVQANRDAWTRTLEFLEKNFID